MKKLTKILLTAGVTLVLGTGIITSYLQAQPQEQVSDLTLANIEAMAVSDDKENGDSEVKIPCTYTGDEYDYCSFIVVTTDGKPKVELLQFFINFWC